MEPEVADVEGRLEPRDLRDVVLEPVLAEELMLLVLELLAELVIGAAPDDVAEGREEHGVLARRVRTIHAHKGSEHLRQLGGRRRAGAP